MNSNWVDIRSNEAQWRHTIQDLSYSDGYPHHLIPIIVKRLDVKDNNTGSSNWQQDRSAYIELGE